MASSSELKEKIDQLRKEADALERQVKQAVEEEKLESIAEIRRMMNAKGVTLEDLANPPKVKIARKKPGTMPAKYRDASGNEWSGKGPAPLWIRRAEDAGQKRDFFLI